MGRVESVLSDYATGAIISLGVQAYFALRIYNGKSYFRDLGTRRLLELSWSGTSICANSYGGRSLLLQPCLPVFMPVQDSNNYRVEPQYPALSWVTDATFTNGMLAHVLFLMVSEVTMVASLAWSLGRPDDYGVKKTTPMLEKLLHYAVARGGMVALAHLYVLTQYFAHPHLLIW
ncbi:hypothetical protein VNI00_016562 [Paramarasmius palmivorus]|uniref:Uncharacterized protein n=1 Tax=Paramarasmius palmivorus TaxID=297713 RepID=A0AAW0BDA4_9AGAR